MAKTTAWVLGAVFVIAGVWGFFGYPLGFMAHDTTGNIIHIIAGLVLVVMAAKPMAANVLKTVGILYVIFAILGWIQQGSGVLGSVFATDGVTNWVYLVLGVVGAALGFASKDSASSSAAPQM